MLNYAIPLLGYYLYAEASWPRRKGDKARLVSTTMNPTNYQQCYLRIYYHMVGQHVGVLRVKTRKCQTCEEKILWQNSLATIDNWVRRTLIVRSDAAFQVSKVDVICIDLKFVS